MAKTGKKHSVWIIILAIMVIIASGITYFGVKNGKTMDDTIQCGLDTLREHFTVTEVERDAYNELKLYGIMKFDIDQYDVEGLGNLCVMTTNMGLMQMSTFVLTPYETNMPMLSTDFMYMFNTRKSYVELYDLVKDTTAPDYQAVMNTLQTMLDGYADLTDMTPSSGWYDHLLTVNAYKTASAAQDDRVMQLFVDSVSTYAEAAVGLAPLSEEDKAEKLAITQEYCDTMVEKGGVSTSIFKKALGDETTADFFNTVFFGPARYAQ